MGTSKSDYLPDMTGLVSLVLDLHITHDLFDSTSDHSPNDHLHYRNDLGGSLNEIVTDKIRHYHIDYNNKRPIYVTSVFMTVIATTSTHRETDSFFSTSGVQIE